MLYVVFGLLWVICCSLFDVYHSLSTCHLVLCDAHVALYIDYAIAVYVRHAPCVVCCMCVRFFWRCVSFTVRYAVFTYVLFPFMGWWMVLMVWCLLVMWCCSFIGIYLLRCVV